MTTHAGSEGKVFIGSDQVAEAGGGVGINLRMDFRRIFQVFFSF